MTPEQKLKAIQRVSPSFCVLPFVHLATQPDGRAKPCCVFMGELHKNSEDGRSGRPYNLAQDSIAEVWNSEAMRELRRKMLAGERVSGCEGCYKEESLNKGHVSYRMSNLEEWMNQEGAGVLERIQRAEASNYEVSEPPLYFDLRQGNICNLACRSCQPLFSQKLVTEFQALHESDEWFRSQGFWDSNFDGEALRWPEHEKFWEELESLLGKTRKFYFTGGEPTMIAKNYKLMETCIERGLSERMELMFNTNLMNLPDRFLKSIARFKAVTLNLSVDGLGGVQEYLRGGSQWSVIEANLRKLAELNLPHVSLNLSTVVQAANALNLAELFHFVDQRNFEAKRTVFKLSPILLVKPDFLDTAILPDVVREMAYDRLADFIEGSTYKLDRDRYSYDKLLQIADKLKQPRAAGAEPLLRKFVHYNRLLDQRRSTDLRQALPELCEHLELGGPDFG